MISHIKTDFDKVIKNLRLSRKNIDLRKKNLNKFISLGLPNKREEDWKFSDLNQIISSNIKNLKFFDKELFSKNIKESDLTNFFPINLFKHNKIIMINGVVDKINFEYEDSKKIIITDTIENESFKKKHSLAYLNNAFTTNYLKIIIKKNYSMKKPLILYNITNKKISSTNINQKLYIELEDNSKLNFISLLVGNNFSPCFSKRFN